MKYKIGQQFWVKINKNLPKVHVRINDIIENRYEVQQIANINISTVTEETLDSWTANMDK